MDNYSEFFFTNTFTNCGININPMNTNNNTKIKRIFKEEHQKQYEAGLINEIGDLTDEGKVEFNEILRKHFEKEFTKIAEDMIEKKNN